MDLEIPALSTAAKECTAIAQIDQRFSLLGQIKTFPIIACKLTWLVLGGDPAVRSRRVEQFTAL